ncbi:CD1e molecule [Homo sapiens]|uniref:Isoform 10 of T-cell surface glycoprotein CD1e, membrane-associated n=1 Tax=Homo sapiens TaxID=9606 RepID=P15812-10|eukprot:NP_001036052.1 T-cell surface glycoprotein CD1e, membrane-associated isoform f precursor [Homo sapiens]
MLLLFLLFEGLCCPGENTAVKPEAWLSCGPSPGPGRLQLVCHVSGFYPKPVWVMWMRGEQEQRGTQRGDVLPNADETWWIFHLSHPDLFDCDSYPGHIGCS